MSFRPAGLSDSSTDEYDDEDGFSLADGPRKKMILPRRQFTNNYTALDNNNCEIQILNDNQDSHLNVLTACMTGQINVIDEFLDLGNNVNAFLNTGWTLLLYASSAVQAGAIRHLLERGANPNTHKNGYTPLMAVCDSSNGKTEQYLECISVLLEAKADPKAINKDRRTALMFAATRGVPEVVQEILKHDANVNAVDNDGRSAIFYAVTSNHAEIVKILIANGASTSITDRRNLTIRDIAITKGYDDILELLNFEEEDIETFCPATRINDWKDAFPAIKPTNNDSINMDIAAVLYGLGLDKYRPIFKGMELKEFLQLTNDELIALGMDIEFHRKQFLNGLLKFHTKKWSHLSLGAVNKTLSYTIYDGIVSLGNAARQINVMGSSFRYIKNNLLKIGKIHDKLSGVQKKAFKDELEKTEKTIGFLKKDLHQILHFARKVEKNNVVPPPADYIGSEKKKAMNWPIILGTTVMAGFYIAKSTYLTKLWN